MVATPCFLNMDFIIAVAMASMPGMAPTMFGTGMCSAGLPRGETLSLSAWFFLIISRPKKVKNIVTSMSMAAAVVAKMSGGYAISSEPLDAMIAIFFCSIL